MTFSLSTIKGNGRSIPVIEVDGRYFNLEIVAPDLLQPSPARGLMNFFDNWARSEQLLIDLASAISRSDTGLISPSPAISDFMTPLQYPRKLILGGANYYEHMFKDAKKPDFRKENSIPVFFLKPPTTSLVGCGKTVRYPVQSREFDWEIELAVIIGRTLRRVSETEAAQGIAGYSVGLDLSARDWQMNPQHPWKFDLFTGKAFDDSCPLGPKFVPARFVDANDLRLLLLVNGEVKQDANTKDMIWSVAEQISVLSEHVTLEPGDILLTGTPAGVGMTTNTFLRIGDKIEAEIGNLGRLEVEIVPDTATANTAQAGWRNP